MVVRLNKKDHDAIQRQLRKHKKAFKKELKKVSLDPSIQSTLKQIFTVDFVIQNLAMVVTWIGLEYIVKQIITYVSTNPATVMKILKFGGIVGVIVAIGVIGLAFIIKEYGTIKSLQQQMKEGKLKDLEGNTIKTKKAFLEAVVFSTVGVKNVKVERFVDHLLKIQP